MKSCCEFGQFSLDAEKRLLLRNGEPVPLSPKVLDTLVALVESRDRVVTKDELLERIWSGTTVEEGGLTRNISILRKTLGEKPDDHQFVVTVPGRGYRFVADVREPGVNEQVANLAPAADVPMAPAMPPPSVRLLARRRLALAGVAGLVVSAVAYTLTTASATAPTGRDITSIAVLPLQNLSGDPGQEFFADGMTEALIGNLAPIRALRVVSRTSVMRFKGSRSSLAAIAGELNVDAVLEGSVQRAHNRVRVTIQLIDARNDTHLWAREYERDLTDVLKLQREVARAVAEEIRVHITAEERARLASAGTVNAAAHQEYLLGKHHLWKLTEDDLARAVDHFERAVQLDPGYADAYAGMSHAWWWRGIWGAKTFREIEAPSRGAARKALALDPRLAEGHVSIGRLKFGHDWDWAGAEADFNRALAIDPNNLDAHFFSAMLFMALGRFPESIDHIARAEQLDPLSSTVQSAFGRVLYRARRFEEAIPHLEQAIALEPMSSGGYSRLADVYVMLDRPQDALELYSKAIALRPRTDGAAEVAIAYARIGKPEEARRMLAGLRETTTRIPLAQAYATLGDNDEAFTLLFRQAEERGTLNYVKTDPRFETLHADPRWALLLRRMNLLDAE